MITASGDNYMGAGLTSASDASHNDQGAATAATVDLYNNQHFGEVNRLEISSFVQ
jgi:hypothetical protein